ncbi:DUF1109 domain-containing protein [Roseateles sp. SL47]|uniref:DUF1109 domain-containing protein n=1 Tax=Roseateles sp. SL47 TaxID=2995138 RepID=UPI00226DA311|nr:DUF1109 domain-containing protein [Roseateles sp. SL47]WAC72581.1 DUF1109 domain-containing protein [Roseateles sp. SL47]
MKTDDLIALLATQAEPVDRSAPARRYGGAMLVSLLGATVLMLATLGLRPDLAAVSVTALFWFKLATPGLLAVGAWQVLLRTARPGMEAGRRWGLVAGPVVVVWLAALGTLIQAPAGQWVPMVMGSSWRSCPFNIALLSMPGFVAIFWAVKGMAPTRLRTAGAVSGLLAGASATVIYCLHCPEMQVAFWAVWYGAGVLIPTIIGALLGPRLLRW